MKASVSMRIWLVVMSAILWTGICLTGFPTIHWLVYLPATGLALAGIIGICPSQIALFKLLGQSKKLYLTD